MTNPTPLSIATHGPHKGYPTPKPCPFCGSTNLRFEFAGSQGFICCDNCGTQGPCDERAADPICDMDAAYLAWNRRAALAEPEPEGPTNAEIHALADELLDGDSASRVDFARAIAAELEGAHDDPS